MSQAFALLVPLFACIAGGYVLGRWKQLPPGPFVTAVMDVFMPALVFVSMLTAPFSPGGALRSALAAVVVLGILLTLCLVAGRLMKKPLRRFALPILFMNSGFLGIPLVSMLYGLEHLDIIIFYDQAQTFCIFTLGIAIAAGGTGKPGEGLQGFLRGLRTFVREPLLIAILAGTVFLALEIRLPGPAETTLSLLGAAAPPLALFALGARLSSVRGIFYPGLAVGLLLRFGGGFAAGLAAVTLLGIDGHAASIVLLASTMPSAVFSYVLAERYQAEPEQAASFLLASTLAAILVLPLVLHLLPLAGYPATP